MHITLLGFVLVPVAMIWMYRPIQLLKLILISAIFEAAAALVFGAFGLQPAMVPGLLFLFYIATQYALGMRYPAEIPALKAMSPLIALLCYAVLSAWFVPNFFAGSVLVEPQRQDPLAYGVLVPLEFSSGNVTQTLYLTINVCIATSVALFMTRAEIPYRKILAAYLMSGYIVVGIVFWEFAGRTAGLPYPDDLLHSNPGWAIVTQAVGSVPRMQGPFSEPSGLGGYLSGITFCSLWLCMRGYQILRPNLLLMLSITCILLSTSTTGMATLVVGFPVTIFVASIGGSNSRGALVRLATTLGLLLLAGVITIGPVFLLRPSLIDSVNTVYESTIKKGDSDSYNERSASDAAAFNTLEPTYGLGAGWGSCRSSSFIPGLLANGGIFGMLMVVCLVVSVVRLGRAGRRASPDHSGRILVDGFSASLCTQLSTALISAPMINSLVFFLQLGCVVGVLARMTTERAPRSAISRTGNMFGAAALPQYVASRLPASAGKPLRRI